VERWKLRGETATDGTRRMSAVQQTDSRFSIWRSEEIERPRGEFADRVGRLIAAHPRAIQFCSRSITARHPGECWSRTRPEAVTPARSASVSGRDGSIPAELVVDPELHHLHVQIADREGVAGWDDEARRGE
jgi:hypothetical protein